MSINTMQPATSLEQLTRTLFNRFDANKDGQVTAEEFNALLSQLLSGTKAAAGRGLAVAAENAKGLPAGVTLSAIDGLDGDKRPGINQAALKNQLARIAKEYGLDSIIDKAGSEALLSSLKKDLEAGQ